MLEIRKLWLQDIENNIMTFVTPSVKSFAANEFPAKLPGSIWAVTTFFNPVGYKNRYENYKKFRESSKRQGLKLLAVELVFGDAKFELRDDDAEMIIRIRGNEKNIMWQKEALLNIGIEKLPEDCDKVIWIDCDIIFQDNDWVSRTAQLLEKYKVVQPFSDVTMKNENEDLVEGKGKKISIYGNIYTRINQGNRTGHPGFVWAARRNVLKEVKLYDKLITGSADVLISDSFCSDKVIAKEFHFKNISNDIGNWWGKSFKLVGNSLSYCDGNIFHLWHGNPKNRRNILNRFVLISNNFDFEKDIKKDQFGIWEWTGNNPKVEKYITKYFYIRNEDDHLSFSYIFAYTSFLVNRLFDGSFIMYIRYELNRFFGWIGKMINKISPRIYNHLVNKKPCWAKPLDI